MFTFFARHLRHFAHRRRIAYARARQTWRWFLRQVRDVQIAVIVDLFVMFSSILLTVWTESNKPARWGLVICFLIGLYIARKLALPVWFGELGAELANSGVHKVDSWVDAVRSKLPWWAGWVVGPGAHSTQTVHVVKTENHDPADVVWHDKSVGGHMFHVLGTVWMWLHVILLLCGTFPVWERDWASVVAMLTVSILFFVWTEDFVDIKKWRARLGYAVTIIAALYLGAMALRTLMPGTYNNLMARFGYHETMQDVTAEATEEQKIDDKKELADLYAQDRQFKKRFRDFRNKKTGATWTVDDAARFRDNTLQIKEMTRSNLKISSAVGTTRKDRFGLMMAGIVLAACLLLMGRR